MSKDILATPGMNSPTPLRGMVLLGLEVQRGEMLGCSKPMAWRPVAAALGEGPGLVVTVPALAPTELPTLQGPWVFRLSHVR